MRLKDKVAVITGAGSGMGRAMATLFASEGARVVAGDWNADRMDEVVAAVKSSGGAVIGAQGNIADKGVAEGWIDLAVKTFGRSGAIIPPDGGWMAL